MSSPDDGSAGIKHQRWPSVHTVSLCATPTALTCDSTWSNTKCIMRTTYMPCTNVSWAILPCQAWRRHWGWWQPTPRQCLKALCGGQDNVLKAVGMTASQAGVLEFTHCLADTQDCTDVLSGIHGTPMLSISCACHETCMHACRYTAGQAPASRQQCTDV